MIKDLHLKSHKTVTLLFLFISMMMSISSVISLEPCHSGMGCMIFIPLIPFVIPVYPILQLIINLLKEITFPYYTFYGMPSILKFFPVFILSTASFIIGYCVVRIFLRFNKNKIDINDYVFDVKLVKKNFILFNFVFIFLINFYIFLQSPPVPFASDLELLKSCGDYDKCYKNYFNSKFSNCSGKSNFFVYPLKTDLLEIDKCSFNSFIEKKPLNNVILNNVSQMNNILKLFSSQISLANDIQKNKFCESFSDGGQEKTGYNISNKDFCMLTFSNLEDYEPGIAIYDKLFNEIGGWKYVYYLSNNKNNKNYKNYKNYKNFVLRSNIRLKNGGEFSIYQGLVDSDFFNDYTDLKNLHKKISESENRINVTEKYINNNKILVEQRVEYSLGKERFYKVYHLIKNKTYIQINEILLVDYLSEANRNLIINKIIEDILNK